MTSPASEPESLRPRVLIVEDYAPMRRALARLLGPEFDVTGVGDGRGGIETAERLQPDVTLVDLHLPDIDGLEVCRTIRRANPGAKLIVFSGVQDPLVEAKALAAGALAFVWKADVGTKLLPAIAEALGVPEPGPGRVQYDAL